MSEEERIEELRLIAAAAAGDGAAFEQLYHAHRDFVLRVAERFGAFNGDGHDYSAEITAIRSQRVLVRIMDSSLPGNESPLKITLVQAISRGERMDYCVQKATELGVAEIQLIYSARVEVRLNEKRLQQRLAHWQSVVISACEQSGRAVVPEVLQPRGIEEWLARDYTGRRFVLDPAAENSISKVDIRGHLELAVGPEGGFSDAEIDLMNSNGVLGVSLGPRVLRTETAAPAAVAILQALAGDM